MNQTIRCLLVAATTVVSLACAAGCNVDGVDSADELEQEDVDALSSAVTACPARGRASAIQLHVTKAFAYTLGAPAGVLSSCTVGTSTMDKAARLVTLNTALANFKSELDNSSLEISDPTKSFVCGVPAVIRSITPPPIYVAPKSYIPGIVNSVIVARFNDAKEALDECYGFGASAFWDTRTSGSNVVGFEIDPADVQLQATLSSGSGATAAAIFTSSGASTTVINWPSTATVGSVAGGTPCSTTGLPLGSEVLREIQVVGTRRKCI